MREEECHEGREGMWGGKREDESVVGRRVLWGRECCGEESVCPTCPLPLVALTLAPTPSSVDTQSVFPSWESGSVVVSDVWQYQTCGSSVRCDICVKCVAV